jgi:hypothetical protein
VGEGLHRVWPYTGRHLASAHLLIGLAISLTPIRTLGQSTSLTAQQIVNRSAAATRQDWEKVPLFDFCELDRDSREAKTYEVLMTYGWPHKQLLAVNDNAVPSEKGHADKLGDPTSESAAEQHKRILQYQKERQQDQRLIEEFTAAMDFALAGRGVINGHNVFIVQATPRPDYVARSRETQVLSAARGTLWIDQGSFRFVKVQAEVFRPVMIAGFVARIEPGTRFELDEMPVDDSGIWLASRFSVQARARILLLFPKSSQIDETYFGYRPSGSLPSERCNRQ